MARELIELVFGVKTSGQPDLDKLASTIRDVSGVSSIASGRLGQLATGLGGAAGAAAGAVAAIAAVGTAAFSLVESVGGAAEELINLSDRTGIAVNTLDRLSAMGKLANVNVGTLAASARTLAALLEDTGREGMATRDAMRALGVSFYEASGAQRDLGIVMEQLLGKLGSVKAQTEQVRLTQQSLGKGGTDLLPLIKSYEELDAQVRKLGFGTREELLRSMSAAADEIDKLGLRWEILKGKLAGPATAVVQIVTRVVDFAADAPGGAARVVAGVVAPSTIGSTVATEFFRTESPSRPRPIGPEYAQGLISAANAPERNRLSQGFRDQFSNSREGLAARAADLQSQIGKLVGALSSGDLAADAFAGRRAEYDRLSRELASIQARLQPAQKRAAGKGGTASLSDFFGTAGFREPLAGFAGFSPESVDAGAAFVAQPTDSAGRQQSLEAYGQGLLAAEQRRREQAKASREAEVSAMVRLVALAGDEYRAAQLTLELRRSSATTALEARQAELDYAVRIAEIEKAREERYKDSARGIYRAIRQRGGGGLRDFALGQLDIQGEALFANVSGKILQTAGGALGRLGAKSGIPADLLAGTLFDPQNAGAPIDRNTKSLDTLRSSVDTLSGVMVGVAHGGAGGGLPGGGFVGGGPGLIGTRGGDFTAGLGSVFGDSGGFAGIRGGSIQIGDGRATASTSARLGNIVGSAGVVVGGIQAIRSGMQRGGAGGTLQTVSGALSIASMIPGPQQPFVQAGALIAGFVSTLFGDNREKRMREQADLLNSRRVSTPEAMSETFDFFSGGAVIDSDYRGRVRIIVHRTVNVNVNALDARSIEERGADIAEAVRQQVEAGHPVRAEVQRAAFN